MQFFNHLLPTPYIQEVLRVSCCDHIAPVDVRLSVYIFHVYTLASTNIDQSPPNLAKMYVTIRSRIVDLVGPELSELPALELEKLQYLTLFTL